MIREVTTRGCPVSCREILSTCTCLQRAAQTVERMCNAAEDSGSGGEQSSLMFRSKQLTPHRTFFADRFSSMQRHSRSLLVSEASSPGTKRDAFKSMRIHLPRWATSQGREGG